MPKYRNKYAALQYRLKKRREKLAKLERLLLEIKRLEDEIEQLHGTDSDTSETVYEALYEPRSAAEA